MDPLIVWLDIKIDESLLIPPGLVASWDCACDEFMMQISLHAPVIVEAIDEEFSSRVRCDGPCLVIDSSVILHVMVFALIEESIARCAEWCWRRLFFVGAIVAKISGWLSAPATGWLAIKISRTAFDLLWGAGLPDANDDPPFVEAICDA